MGTGDVYAPGVYGPGAAGGGVVTTPTITALGSGTSVTVTIAGDAGVTNYVEYKKLTDAAWSDGGSRSGDGDVTVSSLDTGVDYLFRAYSQDAGGVDSETCVPISVLLESASEPLIGEDILGSMIEIELALHAESVTYKPIGGGSRAITAIVDALGPQDLRGEGGANSPTFRVTVKNSSTTGIASSEIKPGAGDCIALPNHIGNTSTVDRQIVLVEYEDRGALQVICQ